MVEEMRASTSSELRHPAEGEVDDEHVATTSGAGATGEAQSEEVDAKFKDIVVPMDRVGPEIESEEAGGSTPAKVRWGEVVGPDGSTLATGSGASAGVHGGGSEESEAATGESESESRDSESSSLYYMGLPSPQQTSEESEAGSDYRFRTKEITEETHEVINVEIDCEETRRYSMDEFGRILQTSQWSLVHRIEVCKVLECNVFTPLMIESGGWMMTPLSRQEYAKQSLALVDRPHGIDVNDINESDLPSLEAMSLTLEDELYEKVNGSTIVSDDTRNEMERLVWQKHLLKLRNNMMERVFADWKALRNRLEEQLKILRDEDKRADWYKRAFKGKNLQPCQIYAAIEKGHVDTMHGMMAEIGEEQWGKLKPKEYSGATPLHWAALHNHVNKRLWDLIDCDPWPEELFDDFGFKPVHMAIFASSFLPASHERTKDILDMIDGYAAILVGDRELDPRDGEKLLDIETWDLPRKKRTSGWNFNVCPLTRSTTDGKWVDSTGATDKRINSANTNSVRSGYGDINGAKFFVFKLLEGKPGKRIKGKPAKRVRGQPGKRRIEYTFVAKCYFSTPIHPLHLAIWIGHPRVVEKLIHSFKGMRHFSLETDNGDTVLHLAFKAMDFERQFPMHNRHKKSGDCTADLDGRVWTDDYMAKSMNYVSREQVMTIMMRYLHSYPHMLNSQNKDGQTPLHIAIFQGNLSCVRALLRCDYVNYKKENEKGLSPNDMVRRLNEEDSIPYRMYANILGRQCTRSEEAGFTTIKCNDVWYFNYHGKIIGHLMEALDPDIVRQRRILQLSQWSYKHRIYALQMLDENPTVGLESVKDTYIKQCEKELTEHGDKGLANDVVEQSVENADKLEKLKFRFIKEISRQYGERLFTLEQGVFDAIEGGDKNKFERLSTTREIILTGSSSYKGANPLHWAVLHGELGILSLISESLDNIKPHKLSYDSRINSRTNLIDVTDGFGFTCLHFASIYSFIRLDASRKPILQSDRRFTSKDSKRDDQTHYEKIVDELHTMDLWRGLHQGLWRDDCGDFVVWGITPTDVIHVDDYLTQTLLSPLHMVVAEPHSFERLLKTTRKEAWAERSVETGDTMLHHAERWELLMRHWSKDKWRKIEFILLEKLQGLNAAVNSRNWYRETPLHRAVCTRSQEWVEVLLQLEHVRFNVRDQKMLTPGDHAAEMKRDTPSDKKVKNIVELLDCYDPESWPRKKEKEQERERDEEKKRRDDQLKAEKKIEEDRKQIEEVRKRTEGLQRERQVYVDAANAILVGAALIGSASFEAWLQPPLGLQPYYSPEFLDTSAPPAMGPIYDSYVAIQQHWTIQMFWVFNSLSFFFSLATVIAGADAALPRHGLDVKEALDSVKRAVKIEAWLLIASILSVISTFATVGFTVLPPIPKYRVYMICTLVIGVVLCTLILIKLLRKLYSSDKTLDPDSSTHQASSS